jgi:hypothetical protein
MPKNLRIMANNNFLARRASSLVDAQLALLNGTMCLKMNGKKHEAKAAVLVLILCDDLPTVQRAVHIIKRDLSSHLIRLQHNESAVCAQLRTLDLFSPSEALSFYHYHLQNAIGNQAQVWLSTKGGIQ